MNCPSRTDETLPHPTWNQSPSSSSADLTTRQTFNGIVNARARRYGDGTILPGDILLTAESDGMGDDADIPRLPFEGGVSKQGFEKTSNHDLGYATVNTALERSSNEIKGAASYLFFASLAVNLMFLAKYVFGGWFVDGTSVYHLDQPESQVTPPSHALNNDRLNPSNDATPSRLGKRQTQGTCGTGQAMEDYSTALHVGALFVILFVSSTACAFPMVVIKFPRLRIPSSFLFLARHFGTGVLLATAFVHLLPTAFLSLTDPCLPAFWTDSYPALAGAIALGAVFLVTVVEMIFSPGQRCCSSTSYQCATSDGEQGAAAADVDVATTVPARTVKAAAEEKSDEKITRETDTDEEAQQCCAAATTPCQNPTVANNTDPIIGDLGPLRGRSSSLGRSLARIEMSEMRRPSQQRQGGSNDDDDHQGSSSSSPSSSSSLEEGHRHHQHDAPPTTPTPSPEQLRKKAILQCMLLEMGILFHSVFIGMALSVSVGKEFVVLWIAIAFHQLFEGLALGSRIAAIDWREKRFQPWLMAVAYGCTTPLGQALGLATHTLYTPTSTAGLLTVGIFNAISAGLLIYASLVELLSEDFLSDESWRLLRGGKRVGACALVAAGAGGMSLVGAWA